MFPLLSNDLILMITYNFTNIHDVINMVSADKTTNQLFDDIHYLYWGRNMYRNELWDRAKKRTKIYIKPYINMKMELLRIYNYQNCLVKHGFEQWTNEDFYQYWETLETHIKTKYNHLRGDSRFGYPLNP